MPGMVSLNPHFVPIIISEKMKTHQGLPASKGEVRAHTGVSLTWKPVFLTQPTQGWFDGSALRRALCLV